MRIDVITLFPELVTPVVESGVVGRAASQQLVELQCWNPRDYSLDKNRRVDDRPYGGGPGMIMTMQPLMDTISAVRGKNTKGRLIGLSPQGRPLKQAMLQQEVEFGSAIFLCGRYEGIDERLMEQVVDEEWSLGDYIISGGELAAMVCVDAMVRLLPGALGHDDSADQDSFSSGLLDFPHFTRPENFDGQTVPQVLMDGNHRQIERWRLKQSLGRTWQRRPDLLEDRELSQQQKQLLEEFINESKQTR